MRRATVLYLSPSAELGGAEHSLLDLARRLDRRAFSPRLACLGAGPLIAAAAARGIPLDVLKTGRAFTRASLRGRRTGVPRMALAVASALSTAWRIRRLVREHRVRLIHSNGNKTHVLSLAAGVGLAVPVVWHVRDFLPDRRLERGLIRLGNLRADAMIANSGAVGAHLLRLGARPGKVHVIPNGIDCVRFSPAGGAAPLRQEFGWPADCRVVGIIGALARWKGQAVFLHAVKEARRVRADVRYVVVGDEIYMTEGHGTFKAELRRLARELGVDDVVAFPGHRDDVPEVMRALDVVVHASIEPEPFGRVVAEAMACGRPVVASDGGGVPEIAGAYDGSSVLLVPRGDASRLASAVLTLLDRADHAATRHDGGRARIEEHFEIGRHARAVETLYRGLVGDGRLKILHAGKFYPPSRGGMETVLEQLCAGTALRWNVTAVVANERARTVREVRDGVRVVRAARMARVGALPVCPTLPLHLWRGAYDCVVLHEPNPLAVAALFARVPARRLVVWHHAQFMTPWWARGIYAGMLGILCRRAACVIVSSPALADADPTIQSAKRIEVIPFGIPVERYIEADEAHLACAREIRSRRTGPIVLFVGRLIYYKGLDVLLRAMRACPGTLLIVGRGPLEDGLRALAARLGVATRVEFVGEVAPDALTAYYRAADVFVLPSTERTEAFGVAQVEAMACGVPVVSTNLPTGVPWVNQDGVTGLIVTPGDADALAAALARLLADDGLRRKLGEAGRRRAVEEFSEDRMLDRFQALIEEIGESDGE